MLEKSKTLLCYSFYYFDSSNTLLFFLVLWHILSLILSNVCTYDAFFLVTLFPFLPLFVILYIFFILPIVLIVDFISRTASVLWSASLKRFSYIHSITLCRQVSAADSRSLAVLAGTTTPKLSA